jgi:hypothetical protein
MPRVGHGGILDHRARDGGADVEAGQVAPGPRPARRDLSYHHVLDVGGGAGPEHHPVGDLARQAQHGRRQPGQVDGDVGPDLEAVEREARVPARPGGRLAAGQQGADQRDVLAHLGHRVSDVLPVPAAHGGPVTGAEAEPEAAAGQVVDRGGRLGHRGGGAVVDRGHRRGQGDRRGEVGQPGQGGERIAGGDVRAVDRVVAELVGQFGVLAHGGDVAGRGDQHTCLHGTEVLVW